MRFLIAFILLFSLNSSVAHAIENKAAAVIKKPSIKTSLSSKKESQSLNESLYEQMDRINQHIHHHVLPIATFVDNDVSFKVVLIQAVKAFKRKVNFSYQSLFNCLFPKHTFW